MVNDPDPSTSTTLIERLQADKADASAWEEFDRRYRPQIHAWCRTWGLQPADAEDVAQVVLAKLVTVIRQYRHQPGQHFRSWLRTVSQHVWFDLCSSQRDAIGGEPGQQLLANLAAREDLERQLADLFDSERLQVAYERVRRRVAAPTWEAFRLLALEGRPGPEVAQRLGMPIAHVYVAKHRVQKLLKAELIEPDDDLTTDFPPHSR